MWCFRLFFFVYFCSLLFILVIIFCTGVLISLGCFLVVLFFVGLVCVVLCGWCLFVLFFCLWASPVGRARFSWHLWFMSCVCLSWCLEGLFMGVGVILWCVVLGELFSLVLFSRIDFCILCINSVTMFPLSSNMKCEGNVYVIWGFVWFLYIMRLWLLAILVVLWSSPVCYVVWVFGGLFMCFIVVLHFYVVGVDFYLDGDKAGSPNPF